MTSIFRLAVAFAAGAVAMYYLDPVVGRRRRALARDQGMAARRDVEDLVRGKSRRAVNRMQGAMAEARARLSPEPVEDEQLRERIRSKLGRVVDRPSAVAVDVHDAQVVLSGSASAEEIDTLMAVVTAMLGVEGVENRLTVEPGETGRSATPRH